MLHHAFKRLSSFRRTHMSKEEDAEYNRYSQYITEIAVKNKEEGREEGREEGVAVGLEKGEVKKAFEIARVLLTMKMDIDAIAIATGLSPEEIRKL